MRSQEAKGLKSRRLGEDTVGIWLEKPPISIDWDIDQILAKGTTLIIAGNVGIGKSWESVHLAFQLRLGRKWHGLQCRELMPFYLSLEFTENQMQKRIQKLAKSYSKDIYPLEEIRIVADKGGNYKLNDDEGKKNLFNLLRQDKMRPPQVIILDPLSLFIKGQLHKVDWNNEIEPVLNEIKAEFNCSIILNHNFRKATHIQGHSEDSFAPDRLKGVSDLIDRADTILMFVAESQPRKDAEGKSVRIEVAKWLCAPKTRDAEWLLQPYRVIWDYDKAQFIPENGLGWTPPMKSKRYTS